MPSRFERRIVPTNTLLASLPVEEVARLESYLEITDLQFSQVLVEFDHAIEYVYFLESAVTSTIVRTPNGEILEVGIMGAEGFVGLSLLYGPCYFSEKAASPLIRCADQVYLNA